MITKKHFKSLAEHIGRAFKEMNDKDKKEIILNEINAFCKEFNDNFDINRFEKAVLIAETGDKTE